MLPLNRRVDVVDVVDVVVAVACGVGSLASALI